MKRCPLQHCTLCVAIAAGVCVLAASCSPVARYEVLSFLLDGVPPPPGVQDPYTERAASPGDGRSVFSQGLQALRSETPKAVAPPVILSIHEPVARKDCRVCHDLERGVTDLSRDATLCDRCHKDQRQQQGWDHGPINLGTCIPCHVPHRSINEHLLSEPLPDVCLACHVDVAPGTAEYHAVQNLEECTECHDPHKMY